MAKIRILHVVSGMGTGGIETLLINLYRNIDRDTVQFDFVIHKKAKNGFEDEIRALGGKIFYFSSYKMFNTLSYASAAASFLRDHPEYGIVHIHLRKAAAVWALEAKKDTRISIVHSHNTTNGYGAIAFLKNILQFPCRYIADYFMGCSKEANIWMFGKTVAESDKCYVLRNGIPADSFRFDPEIRAAVRAELGIEGDEFVVGSTGRLVPQKDYPYLLKIFREIVKQREKAKLIIVGGGVLRQELEGQAKQLGIFDSLLFTGARKDVNRILNAFDSFVLCSKNEGFGIAVIEAQANGLPVTASTAFPASAGILNSTLFLEKSASLEQWVKAALRETAFMEREGAFEKIKACGYDIVQSADWLSDFYFTLLREKSGTHPA